MTEKCIPTAGNFELSDFIFRFLLDLLHVQWVHIIMLFVLPLELQMACQVLVTECATCQYFQLTDTLVVQKKQGLELAKG